MKYMLRNANVLEEQGVGLVSECVCVSCRGYAVVAQRADYKLFHARAVQRCLHFNVSFWGRQGSTVHFPPCSAFNSNLRNVWGTIFAGTARVAMLSWATRLKHHILCSRHSFIFCGIRMRTGKFFNYKLKIIGSIALTFFGNNLSIIIDYCHIGLL